MAKNKKKNTSKRLATRTEKLHKANWNLSEKLEQRYKDDSKQHLTHRDPEEEKILMKLLEDIQKGEDKLTEIAAERKALKKAEIAHLCFKMVQDYTSRDNQRYLSIIFGEEKLKKINKQFSSYVSVRL